MSKGKIFSKIFLEIAFYGPDTEPEPLLVKSRNRNWNRTK